MTLMAFVKIETCPFNVVGLDAMVMNLTRGFSSYRLT